MAKSRPTSLPAPFLKRLSIRPDAELPNKYPFNLPWLDANFELVFDSPLTILVGENGTGKSTLIEAIAALCGYDEAGGGQGYRPLDHSRAIDRNGALLADVLRPSWLPRVTAGWFFRAESFYSVARYLDHAAVDVGAAPPNFLSWSHGEGFVRFFEERLGRQGIYFLDEPESALSPRRQLELVRLLKHLQEAKTSQVIMATHSPILMAVPGARLLEISRAGFSEVTLTSTHHFRLYRDFIGDPEGFIRRAIDGED